MWWKKRRGREKVRETGELGERAPAASPADELVDCRGLLCPLPLIKAKQALDRLEPGGLLELVATDAGAVADFDAFCRETGHDLERQAVGGGEFRFWIRKADPSEPASG